MNGCEYPVMNPLARAARPKLCGKAAGDTLWTLVPYIDEAGRLDERIQPLCLDHSISLASWKMAENLPKEPFTHDELTTLHVFGIPLGEVADPYGPWPVEGYSVGGTRGVIISGKGH